MKRINLLLILIATVLSIQAQNITFVDANFKNALIHNPLIDRDNNDEISVSEAEMAIMVDVSNQSISDLSGIEHFINMDELNCSNNNIDSLNLLLNTKIRTLYCSDNILSDTNNDSKVETMLLSSVWNISVVVPKVIAINKHLNSFRDN